MIPVYKLVRIRTGSNEDWNQVRYGRPQGYSACPDTTAGFLLQSGFGFDGADSTGENYHEEPTLRLRRLLPLQQPHLFNKGIKKSCNQFRSM